MNIYALAYHGFSGKRQIISMPIIKPNFDPNLPKINVVPQDIGRVLLNLINNAFYAVDKRAKEIDPLAPDGGIEEQGKYYKPTVTISTASYNPPLGGRGVRVAVKDNGDGIPAEIIDKIFQPFFTTKPTGQGTGLGLSLAYDMVKAHGGELKVETNSVFTDIEGFTKGTKFTVMLPA
jgi:signal transduction histidine kinase